MKRILRNSAFIMAVVLGITACVRQMWIVKYSAAENTYTNSRTIVASPDGALYVFGTTRDLTATKSSYATFLTAFDGNGTRRWEKVFPGDSSDFLNPTNGKRVAVDATGNVYVARTESDLQKMIIDKFDASGVKLGEWTASEDGEWRVDDLKVGPDQRLYLSMSGGSVVQVYSLEGELLWRNPLGPASPDLANRQGDFDFLPDGRVLHVTDHQLRVFEADGSVLADINPADLGVEFFAGAVVVDDNIVALGTTYQQVELFQLDSSLAEISRTAVGAFDGLAMLDRAGANVCVVTGPLYLQNEDRSYQIWQFSSDGVALSRTDMPSEMGTNWWLQDVIGSEDGCDLSVYVNDVEKGWLSRIRHVNKSGKASDTIEIKGFGVGDFILLGKDVVQVGFANLDVTGAEVLLARHRRY